MSKYEQSKKGRAEFSHFKPLGLFCFGEKKWKMIKPLKKKRIKEFSSDLVVVAFWHKNVHLYKSCQFSEKKRNLAIFWHSAILVLNSGQGGF